jgi:hypothetical protein
MTLTKWLASFCLIGLLLAGAAFFYLSGKSAPIVASSSAVVAQPPTTVPPEPAPLPFKVGPPMKRVMDLYESESKRVGQIDNDPKGTQKRLEESARELSPEEIRWLETQAGDRKNDADARFFAAYMMGLSHKVEAVEGLGRIAVSPIPPTKVDRLAEQERVFRASAIEGMSLACKEFPVAVKDGLTDVIARQQDESLRDRANRGLYACQFGKSIESQDKEALQKVRSAR